MSIFPPPPRIHPKSIIALVITVLRSSGHPFIPTSHIGSYDRQTVPCCKFHPEAAQLKHLDGAENRADVSTGYDTTLTEPTRETRYSRKGCSQQQTE